MPCYTISQAKLDLGMKKSNIEALKKALTNVGFVQTDVNQTDKYSWTNGKDSVTFDREKGLTVKTYGSAQFLGERIQQAYTGAVVQMTAKKFGWQVQAKGENQFLVTKR